jgi:hypothetical protein
MQTKPVMMEGEAQGSGEACCDSATRLRAASGRSRLNKHSAQARIMFNAEMVNAESPCLNRAHFCIFFAVSGRFLHFKIPFKYICNSQINPSPTGKTASATYFIVLYQ